jgi:hypothetical protein
MTRLAVFFLAVPAFVVCHPPDSPTQATCTDGIGNGDETGVDCGGSCPACPKPKGDRLLGINPYPSKDGDDATAFTKVLSAGVNAMSTGWSWPELELAPGVFDTALLDYFNSLYAVAGFKIVLMINPIETDLKAVPADLADLAFDDPVMIARFKSLLDVVFNHLPDLDIDTLLIGNEANSHLIDNPSKWGAYQTLVEAASAHAKSLRPGIKVGVEGMREGFFSDEMQALNRSCDIIALTYYPSVPKPGHWDFPDLSVMEGDLAALTAAYPDKEIYIIELGYSSSEVFDSSQEEQEAFVREAFRVWDLYESRITMVSFFMLHDYDPVWIKGLMTALGLDEHPYYDEIFAGFTTVGLRTYLGEDKLAFPAFVEEASARGWEPMTPNQ